MSYVYVEGKRYRANSPTQTPTYIPSTKTPTPTPSSEPVRVSEPILSQLTAMGYNVVHVFRSAEYDYIYSSNIAGDLVMILVDTDHRDSHTNIHITPIVDVSDFPMSTSMKNTIYNTAVPEARGVAIFLPRLLCILRRSTTGDRIENHYSTEDDYATYGNYGHGTSDYMTCLTVPILTLSDVLTDNISSVDLVDAVTNKFINSYYLSMNHSIKKFTEQSNASVMMYQKVLDVMRYGTDVMIANSNCYRTSIFPYLEDGPLDKTYYDLRDLLLENERGAAEVDKYARMLQSITDTLSNVTSQLSEMESDFSRKFSHMEDAD